MRRRTRRFACPLVAGVDEVGRGPLAGPVVAAAVILPARPLLRGEHTSLAVRVSDHPLVRQLCAAFGGPLVSSSANRAGEPPAMSAADVRAAFGEAVTLLDGALGGYARPSTIRDLQSGETLRR